MSDAEDYLEDEDDIDEAYFYVEESFQVVDDLAEHTVASPPQINVIASDEPYDPFDYWEDIENCTDGYIDSLGPQSSEKTAVSRASQKRKSSNCDQQVHKKRKTQGSGSDTLVTSEIPPVSWKSAQEKRQHLSGSRQVQESDLGEPVAIFRNWRERFKDKPGFATVADTEDGDDPQGASATSSDDDGSQDEHQQQIVEHLESSGLNVDALKSALAKNLTSSNGLPAGLDESTLLEYVMQMMTNGNKTEGLLGQLTDELFEGADESNVEDIQEWVSKQKGESGGEKVGSSGERAIANPSGPADSHTQPKSNLEQEKSIEAVSVRKGGVNSRTGKRKTTEMDCGASLKPQAKRREIAHTRKDAKVL